MAARARALSRVLRSCTAKQTSALPRSASALPSQSSLIMTPLSTPALLAAPSFHATLAFPTSARSAPQRKALFGGATIAAPFHTAGSLHFAPRRPATGISTKSGGEDSALVAALDAEIQHENETYEAPEELSSGPPKPWVVESSPGAAELVLRRSFEGEDIEIVVSEPATEEEFDDGLEGVEGEEGEEKAEGEEEEAAATPYLPLRVSITKKAADGTLQTLEFECGISEEDDEFLLEGVNMENPSVSEDSIAYRGPDYLTLDPALQDQFAEYLSRRGLTQELGSFIRASLEQKEQQEYVGWLTRVKKFLKL